MDIKELLCLFPKGCYKFSKEELVKFWDFVSRSAFTETLGQQRCGDFYLEVTYKWLNTDGNPIYGISFYPMFKVKKYLNQNADYSVSGLVTVTPTGVETPYVG